MQSDFDISQRSRIQRQIMQLNGEDLIVMPKSVFKNENEFNLYESVNKIEKQFSLGPLYKVKSLLNED